MLFFSCIDYLLFASSDGAAIALGVIPPQGPEHLKQTSARQKTVNSKEARDSESQPQEFVFLQIGRARVSHPHKGKASEKMNTHTAGDKLGSKVGNLLK